MMNSRENHKNMNFLWICHVLLLTIVTILSSSVYATIDTNFEIESEVLDEPFHHSTGISMKTMQTPTTAGPIASVIYASYFDYVKNGSTLKGLRFVFENLLLTTYPNHYFQFTLPPAIPILPSTTCVVLLQGSALAPGAPIVLGNVLEVYPISIFNKGSTIQVECTAVVGAGSGTESFPSLDRMIIKRLALLGGADTQLAIERNILDNGPYLLPNAKLNIIFQPQYTSSLALYTLQITNITNLTLLPNTEIEIPLSTTFAIDKLTSISFNQTISVSGPKDISVMASLQTNRLFIKVPSEFTNIPINDTFTIVLKKIKSPRLRVDLPDLPTVTIWNGGTNTSRKDDYYILPEPNDYSIFYPLDEQFGFIESDLYVAGNVNATILEKRRVNIKLDPFNVTLVVDASDNNRADFLYLGLSDKNILNYPSDLDSECKLKYWNVVGNRVVEEEIDFHTQISPDGKGIYFTPSETIPYVKALVAESGFDLEGEKKKLKAAVLSCTNVLLARFSHGKIENKLAMQVYTARSRGEFASLDPIEGGEEQIYVGGTYYLARAESQPLSLQVQVSPHTFTDTLFIIEPLDNIGYRGSGRVKIRISNLPMSLLKDDIVTIDTLNERSYTFTPVANSTTIIPRYQTQCEAEHIQFGTTDTIVRSPMKTISLTERTALIQFTQDIATVDMNNFATRNVNIICSNMFNAADNATSLTPSNNELLSDSTFDSTSNDDISMSNADDVSGATDITDSTDSTDSTSQPEDGLPSDFTTPFKPNLVYKKDEIRIELNDGYGRSTAVKDPMVTNPSIKLIESQITGLARADFKPDGRFEYNIEFPIETDIEGKLEIKFPLTFNSPIGFGNVNCTFDGVARSIKDKTISYTNDMNNQIFIATPPSAYERGYHHVISCDNIQYPTPILDQELTNLPLRMTDAVGSISQTGTQNFIVGNIYPKMMEIGTQSSKLSLFPSSGTTPSGSGTSGSTTSSSSANSFTFTMKPFPVALILNSVLRVSFPQEYAIYYPQNTFNCNLYGEKPASGNGVDDGSSNENVGIKYGSIVNTPYYVRDYQSFYIQIIKKVPAQSELRFECSTLHTVATPPSTQLPIILSIFSRNPKEYSAVPSIQIPISATIDTKITTSKIGQKSNSWVLTGKKQASLESGILMTFTNSNTYFNGGDIIRITFNALFDFQTNCDIRLSPPEDEYSTVELPTEQDSYKIQPNSTTSTSSGSIDDGKTFLDFHISKDVTIEFGKTTKLQQYMMNPFSILYIVCNNVRLPAHSHPGIDASVTVYGYNSKRPFSNLGLNFPESTPPSDEDSDEENEVEVIRSQNTFKQIFSINPAPMIDAKVTHSIATAGAEGVMKIILPKTTVLLPKSSTLDIWLPNTWHSAAKEVPLTDKFGIPYTPAELERLEVEAENEAGDQDAGWTPPENEFICEMPSYPDLDIEVETAQSNYVMFKRIRVIFSTKALPAQSTISITCINVKAPRKVTKKENILHIYTMDTYGRKLEETDEGSLPAIKEKPSVTYPLINIRDEIVWKRSLIFSDEERIQYMKIYKDVLTALSPKITIISSKFSSVRPKIGNLVENGKVSGVGSENIDSKIDSTVDSNEIKPPVKMTVTTTSDKDDDDIPDVVIYTVITDIEVEERDDRDTANVQQTINMRKKFLLDTFSREMSLSVYDPNEVVLPRCKNGVFESENGETDVDCGGTKCEGCAVSKRCIENRDCRTGLCREGFCAYVSQDTSSTSTSYSNLYIITIILSIVTLVLTTFTMRDKLIN